MLGEQMEVSELLHRYGLLYSEELGIDVNNEPFKWFIASILFGARISTTIAKNTYKMYSENGLISPEKIAASTKQELVIIHGRGGYTRYDEITAEYIIGITRKLLKEFNGDIKKIDEISQNPNDLEKNLQEFRGIGPVTTKIFLRELRGIWKNADPKPTSVEIQAAKELGLISSEKNALRKLKKYWCKNKIDSYNFRNFETALVRYGLKLHKGKTEITD